MYEYVLLCINIQYYVCIYDILCVNVCYIVYVYVILRIYICIVCHKTANKFSDLTSD